MMAARLFFILFFPFRLNSKTFGGIFGGKNSCL